MFGEATALPGDVYYVIFKSAQIKRGYIHFKNN